MSKKDKGPDHNEWAEVDKTSPNIDVTKVRESLTKSSRGALVQGLSLIDEGGGSSDATQPYMDQIPGTEPTAEFHSFDVESLQDGDSMNKRSESTVLMGSAGKVIQAPEAGVEHDRTLVDGINKSADQASVLRPAETYLKVVNHLVKNKWGTVEILEQFPNGERLVDSSNHWTAVVLNAGNHPELEVAVKDVNGEELYTYVLRHERRKTQLAISDHNGNRIMVLDDMGQSDNPDWTETDDFWLNFYTQRKTTHYKELVDVPRIKIMKKPNSNYQVFLRQAS